MCVCVCVCVYNIYVYTCVCIYLYISGTSAERDEDAGAVLNNAALGKTFCLYFFLFHFFLFSGTSAEQSCNRKVLSRRSSSDFASSRTSGSPRNPACYGCSDIGGTLILFIYFILLFNNSPRTPACYDCSDIGSTKILKVKRPLYRESIHVVYIGGGYM